MSRGDELHRQDILDACDELSSVVASRGSVDEGILLRAAERLLEMIGEAATACSTEFREALPQVDWAGLSGLRIVLAHHYHRTQPDLIWQFATVEAPELRSALTRSADSGRD